MLEFSCIGVFVNVQGASQGGDRFEVTKFGHGRVALAGFARCACNTGHVSLRQC